MMFQMLKVEKIEEMFPGRTKPDPELEGWFIVDPPINVVFTEEERRKGIRNGERLQIDKFSKRTSDFHEVRVFGRRVWLPDYCFDIDTGESCLTERK